MVLSAITFFLQMLTALFYNVEQSWVITTIDNINITIGSIVLWYLCIAVILSIMARLLGGIANTWKETMKDD